MIKSGLPIVIYVRQSTGEEKEVIKQECNALLKFPSDGSSDRNAEALILLLCWYETGEATVDQINQRRSHAVQKPGTKLQA